MRRFLVHFRMALWRAFQHDAFAVAKAGAFSAILTLFPAILVLASILSVSRTTEVLFREVSHALGRLLPGGTSGAVLQYFTGKKPVHLKFVLTIIAITLWTGSGVMISWMEGFRNAYQMPKMWGLVKERLIAFLLVVLAGVPLVFASFLLVFGNQIEGWIIYRVGHELGPYILGLWTALRWIIAALTSIAVIGLIFHHGVPRTQPWHRVLPGSVLATVLWFVSTVVFGVYLRRFGNYDVIYGSVATAIALLIWLYLVSTVILIGAEFNAVRYPRFLFGTHSDITEEQKRVEER
ncbi:MAG TPA: YihY/virulence factor BrkB family protein [Candidatus Binatia bacterium]|nr:YihY/virulence factor BrkB family protein [Candidatus Binatia bacterium]